MFCLSEPLPTQKHSWGNKAWGCIQRQRRWVISPLAMMDYNNCGNQRWFNDAPNALFITLMLLEIGSSGHNDVRSSMWMQSLYLPAKWKLFKEWKETFAHDSMRYTSNDFRVCFRHNCQSRFKRLALVNRGIFQKTSRTANITACKDVSLSDKMSMK